MKRNWGLKGWSRPALLAELARAVRQFRVARLLQVRLGGRGAMKVWSVVAAVSMVLSLATVALTPATTSASYTDVLANGGFENGFASQGGCGMVGSGWGCFTNGGAANYGFYDDQWERTVAAGKHSQLIEVNTKGIMVGDPDRYAGIYQTVRVVDWGQYTLNLMGMLRTTNVNGEDPWRYRVQVGYTDGAYANWQAVTNWQDVGWDTYYERTNPGSFSSYTTNLTAQSDYVTIYLRVWKKWGVPNEELDVNFDAISLYGPSPYGPPVVTPVQPIYPDPVGPVAPGCADPCNPVVVAPVQPVQPIYPVQPGCVDPCVPVQPLPIGVCAGPNLVYNGDFEAGFNPVPVGHVGNAWGYFTNGGAANYGFYDDQWTPVVADGRHSQLIEINSKGVYPADNDRYAGIYQYLTGLQPGVTYEFRMKGGLRGAGNEDDPYRFAAQWGYLPGYQGDWGKVNNWTEMNLGPIGVRTEPGPMTEYTMQFTAPASDLTLFIRGWKKWGITNVEMDFNIDSVSVRSCLLGTGGPVIYPPVQPVQPECVSPCGDWVQPVPLPEPIYPVDPGCVDPCGGWQQPVPLPEPIGPVCSYTVQPGDTLAWIAQWLGVSQYDLIAANGIRNPDFIYVGQVLVNPACGGPVNPPDPGCQDPCGGWQQPVPLPQPLPPVDTGCEDPCGWHGGGSNSYTVRPGDNLSTIAAAFGVSVHELMRLNGIANPNIIYVGQQLVIP